MTEVFIPTSQHTFHDFVMVRLGLDPRLISNLTIPSSMMVTTWMEAGSSLVLASLPAVMLATYPTLIGKTSITIPENLPNGDFSFSLFVPSDCIQPLSLTSQLTLEGKTQSILTQIPVKEWASGAWSETMAVGGHNEGGDLHAVVRVNPSTKRLQFDVLGAGAGLPERTITFMYIKKPQSLDSSSPFPGLYPDWLAELVSDYATARYNQFLGRRTLATEGMQQFQQMLNMIAQNTTSDLVSTTLMGGVDA